MNPRFNNPNLTHDEEQMVMRVHDAIVTHSGYTGGYCGLAAVMIVAIGGENYEIMACFTHWWARNKHTGAILDPTVDQFDKSRVDYDDPTSLALPGEEYAHIKLYPQGAVDTFERVLDSYRGTWDAWAKDFCMPAQDKKAAA